MLDEPRISRIGYFITIGLLAVCVMFLGYKVGSHEGDMKAIGIEKNYAEAERDSSAEALKICIEHVEYYEVMFSRALQTIEDGMVFLEKDTLIIPPQPPQAETKQAT